MKQIEYNNACENDIQWPFSDAVTELTVECTFLHAQRSVSVSKKSFITFMINDLNALCFLDDVSHVGYTPKIPSCCLTISAQKSKMLSGRDMQSLL